MDGRPREKQKSKKESRTLTITVLILGIFMVPLAIFLVQLNTTALNPGLREEQVVRAAVSSDADPCSTVGAEILKKGGTAIDAAIATSFCLSVVYIHYTGIGGGGFLIYYNASTNASVAIDFRETAARAITEKDVKNYGENENSTIQGGSSVMVPGFIKGLHEAWLRFGKVPWADLLQPSVELAKDGFKVTDSIVKVARKIEPVLRDERFERLRNLLMPNNKPILKGDILKQPELSNTLEMIAKNGPDYFYNSKFTSEMVKELQNEGSLLTDEDFQLYSIKMRKTITTNYSRLKLHGVPLPCGGPVLGLIFNILDGYNFTKESFNKDPVLAYHRIIEAFKFSYAQRLHLGDPDFNDTLEMISDYMLDPLTAKEMRSMISDSTTHDPSYYTREMVYNPPSHGTAHVSVYAENGDAVAVTHSVNTEFGSKLYSSGGILFNNDMDDFSVAERKNTFGYPPSPANYISARHRALSSESPTIITKDNKVVMVIGASGGSRIPTATAQVILKVLSFGLSIEEAVHSPRLHHQLLPNELCYEENCVQGTVDGLKNKMHEVVQCRKGAYVQAIYIDDNGVVYTTPEHRIQGRRGGY